MKRFATAALIAVVACMAAPAPAGALAPIDGTPGNDRIYFGYCDTCHSGGPGLMVCLISGGPAALDDYAMDNGLLEVRGLEGHDRIEAVSGRRIDDCGFEFGDISLLTVEGGDDNDYIMGTGIVADAARTWTEELNGGAGNDRIIGANGDDTLNGGNGEDYLSGYSGDDTLRGGDGDGDDHLCGDQDDDHLFGDGDNDVLLGATGDDEIDGGGRVGHGQLPLRVTVAHVGPWLR